MIWDGLAPPYSTIVADPPWPVSGAGPPWPVSGAGPAAGREGWLDSNGPSRPMPYSVMSLDEIRALPVGDLAAPDAHLYLWTTNGFLPDAFSVVAAWGFTYSTTLVWAKAPMGSGLGGAFGICTEYLLFCRRGSLAAKSKLNRTWFDWKRPYDGGKPHHSAKPPAALDVVEQISPGPYCELFSRKSRLGWDAWGYGYEKAAKA